MSQKTSFPVQCFRQLGVLCLAFAAVAKALWILARGRRRSVLPAQPSRLACASLLLAAVLPTILRAQRPEGVMCYDVAAPPKPKISELDRLPAKLNVALKALWLTLDQDKGEEFRTKIELAEQQGYLEKRIGELLVIAQKSWAHHAYRTRGEGKTMTCYLVMPPGVPSWERAVTQLELLAKTRKAGKLDEYTADRVTEALAKELEILDPEGAVQKGQAPDAINTGKVKAQPTAIKAAEIIVGWESEPASKK